MLGAGLRVALLAALFAPVSAGALDRDAAVRYTQQVESCFNAWLAAEHAKDSTLPLRANAFTTLFVFEHTAAFLGSIAPGAALSAEQVNAWCKEDLAKAYLQAYRAAFKDRAQTSDDVLAPWGTAPVESRSFFIQAYQHASGKHVFGHSDITAVTLRRLQPLADFSGDAIEVISRASQLPDIFRWDDDRYHAQTAEYRAGDGADRGDKIMESTHHFRQLVSGLVQNAVKYARNRELEEALVLIGAASHAVQDLVYHRGITLRQHSGLAYFVARNPDFPEGAAEAARLDESEAYTRRIVLRILDLLDPVSRSRLLAWTKPAGFSLRKAATRIFGPDEQIGLQPLISYWAMHLQYKDGTRGKAELEDSGCPGTTGLACWDVDAVMKEALR